MHLDFSHVQNNKICCSIIHIELCVRFQKRMTRRKTIRSVYVTGLYSKRLDSLAWLRLFADPLSTEMDFSICRTTLPQRQLPKGILAIGITRWQRPDLCTCTPTVSAATQKKKKRWISLFIYWKLTWQHFSRNVQCFFVHTKRSIF